MSPAGQEPSSCSGSVQCPGERSPDACFACQVFAVVHIMQQNCLMERTIDITYQIQPKSFSRVIGAVSMSVPGYINVAKSLRNFH